MSPNMRVERVLLGIAVVWIGVTWIGSSPAFAAMDDEDGAPTPRNPPDPSSDSAPGNAILGWELPAWLELGGQIRGRVEDPSGTSLLKNDPNTYYLSRIRMHLGIKPTSWLRFFGEAQDARVGGYDTSPAPATIYNPMDIRQLYLQAQYDGPIDVLVRAGRQELAFGGERLIGPADWGMSHTFDVVDLSLSEGRAKVDLFAGSEVLVDPTRLDRSKPGEHLYGAYGSIKKVTSWLDIEPYLLFKQNVIAKSETGVVGSALIESPGVRVLGKTPGRFDYVVEFVVQRGSYSTDKVAAAGASYVGGWTVNHSRFQPRLSVEYNYASGDPNSKDGMRDTFDQFYPSNHAYYGMMDQFGWKNMKNARAGFDCLLTRKFKLRTDFNQFYLATVQDGLYNTSGSSIALDRKATSGHIGSETNTVALYQWSKIWKFGAGYGHLFAGEYLKESKAAGFGYTYPYIMFVGTI
jgi:hypothetical protein